jgi:hypothetical protein
MNDRIKGLNDVESASRQGAGRLSGSRLQVIAAAVGLAVLLVGGARWSDRDAGPAQQAAVQPMAAAQAEPTAFDYFPDQYVNQAREVEEHIQAF